MPYDSTADVPSYVPKGKRRQWLAVFNSAWKRAKKDGKSGNCEHMDDGNCTQSEVLADPEVKELLVDGLLPVEEGDCCNEYDPAGKDKSMKAFKKFIPFAKVDAAKREVWGIVTAEVPDKEDEVCDYDGTKPFYEAVIAEFSKATDGKNFFPLREMHQLSAVGKGIGFEFRDDDKEIFMGFKVVDDEAWKKVDEGVYTGFSHGGSIVGDLVPDPVFKGCKRYVADPSEVSLVDNPCLGVAHFAYIRADNAVELRKFKKTEDAAVVPLTRLQGLVDSVEALKAKVADGKISVNKARSTLIKRDADRVKKLLSGLRVPVRTFVNKKQRTWKNMPNQLLSLDNDLGYLTRSNKLSKGLYTVGRLAEYIEGLSYMLCGIAQEEEWEGEDSTVPGLLAENVTSLLDTFLAYAEEEAEELRAEVASRV